ncbi:MAG TPA: hypothetical protein DC045_18425, partial [Marinobacter adhaerens]|nr:hypothetical protein [Marinobacter adhaerens]
MEPDGKFGPVLAGPILRHSAPDSIVLWLVTSEQSEFAIQVFKGTELLLDRPLADSEFSRLRIGTRAWLNLLTITPEATLPKDTRLEYDLGLTAEGSEACQWIRTWAPHLCPEGRERP